MTLNPCQGGPLLPPPMLGADFLLPPAGGRLGRPRPAVVEGSFGCWLWDDYTSRDAAALPEGFDPPVERRRCRGLAVVTWKYHPAPFADGIAPPRAPVRVPLARSATATPPWGRIDYAFERAVLLEDPVILAATAFEEDVGLLELRHACADLDLTDGSTVRAFLEGARPRTFARHASFPADVVDAAADGSTAVFKMVPLTMRQNFDDFVASVPSAQNVARWRRDAGVQVQRPRPGGERNDPDIAYEKHLFEVPEKWDDSYLEGSKTDPVRLLNALHSPSTSSSRPRLLKRARRGRSTLTFSAINLARI